MSEFNDFLDQSNVSKTITPKKSDNSSFSSFISESQGKNRLSMSFNEGFKKDKTKGEKILNLQIKTGLPEDLIERNLDEIENQASKADFNSSRFWNSSPIVAEWLSESPNNVASAKEDITKLSYLERQIKNISQQFDQGKRTTELSEIGEKAMLGIASPSDRLRQKQINQEMASSQDYGIDGFFEGIPGAVSNQIPIMGKTIFGQAKGAAVGFGIGALKGAGAALIAGQSGPQIGTPEEIVTVPSAAIATGTVYAGFGWRYGAAVEAARMEAGLAYLEYENIKDENGNRIPREAALGASAIVGAINGSLEAVGLHSITKSIPGLRNLTRPGIKKILTTPTVRRAITGFTRNISLAMAGEGITEFMQEVVKVTGKELLEMYSDGTLSNASTSDILSRVFSEENMVAMKSSLRQGAQAGGGISMSSGAVSLATDIKKAQKAKNMKAALEEVGKTASESSVVKNIPEQSKALIKKIADSGETKTLYAPIETWQEYWQSKGIDPQEAASEVLGEDVSSYTEALSTGADIAIPVEKYVSTIATTEHNEFFQSEVKANPDDMNDREANEFIQEMDNAESERINELMRTPNQEEGDLIQENVTKQLQEAGVDESTAQSQAKIVSEGFKSLASRSGSTPKELFDKYNLKIRSTKHEGSLEYIKTRPLLTPAQEKQRQLIVSDLQEKGFHESQPIKELSEDQKSYWKKLKKQAPSSVKITDGKYTIKRTDDLVRAITDNTFSQGERGKIRFNDKRQFEIELLEDADLSTFLHETGHFYLEVLGDLAEKKGANPEIVNDYNSVLRWLGVKKRKEITVEHHEKWARGFEKYLMKGEAPSIALRNSFAKFRAWLVSIYKKMKVLDVKLSDDVVGVMDRILASNEDIEAALQDQNILPLFSSLSDAGLTKKKSERYAKAITEARNNAFEEMTQKHIDQIEREKKKWWKQESAILREKISKEIYQEKVYIALSNMQSGKLPDGSELPPGIDKIKLNKDALLASYDKNFIQKSLPRPFIYSREGGLHHDVAAQIFGYQSGDQMLQEIANARPMREEISFRVDRDMKEKYGDILNDGSSREEAIKVIHNDKTAELLRMELKHLASSDFAKFKGLLRKINKPVPTTEIVKNQADEIIRTKNVKDIKPHLYKSAESKASRQAQELFLKGDFSGAFDAKQRQLLNHELYRASVKAIEDVEKIVSYMSKFQKEPIRKKIGLAGHNYLDQIDSIMERFSFRKVSLKSIEEKASLRDFVDEQNELGFTVDIPAKILNEAFRKSYLELSYKEVSDIRDSVKVIEHLSKTKNKLLSIKRARDLQSAEDEIIASISANHKVKNDPIDFAPGLKKRLVDAVSNIAAAHTKMEFLFEWLDGNKENGVVWSYLFKPFVDAEAKESDMMREASSNMRRIFGKYSRRERATWFLNKEFIPEINNSMNKANMLAVALNWGNAYNREALMDGYGWSDVQVNGILSRLDKRDWDTVQEVWDYIDSYWPEIEKQEKELSGISPAKVEPSKVDTKFGEYRGGYYPVIFDSKLSHKQAKLEEAISVKEMFGGNWARAMTKNGHTKERTNTGGKPLKLELSGLVEHISAVVHDLSHRKAIIDVSRIVERKNVRDYIESTVGKNMYRQINPWLISIAGDRRTEPHNKIEGIISRARMGATNVYMGLKMTTAIVQVSGYYNSIKELGPKYAYNGLKSTLKNPLKIKQSYDFMAERSSFMRDRLGNYDRDVRVALKKMNIAGTKQGIFGVVDSYMSGLRDSYFSLIGYMDLAVSMPTWYGAYNKAMDGKIENIDKGDEKSAIYFADGIVRKTQGSGGPKDLSSIQTSSELFKIFTMFYSSFSVLFNQFQKTKNQFVSDRNVPKFIGSMFLLWFLPAVMDDIILGRAPDTDDEEKLNKWFLQKELSYPFQSIVFARDIAHGMGDFGYSPSPVFSVFESLIRTGKAGMLLATGNKDGIERKDVKSVFFTAGYLAALPSSQVWLSAEYFYDWMTGEEKPDNFIEGAWRGLVTGKPRD